MKRLSPHLGALEPVSVALIVRVLPPTRRVRSSEPFARTLPAQKELVFSFTLVGCSAPSQSCPPNRSLPIFCLYSQLSSTHTDAHICTTHTMGYVFTLDLERYPSPLSTMDELPSHWCLSKDIDGCDDNLGSSSSSSLSSSCTSPLPGAPSPRAPSSNKRGRLQVRVSLRPHLPQPRSRARPRRSFHSWSSQSRTTPSITRIASRSHRRSR